MAHKMSSRAPVFALLFVIFCSMSRLLLLPVAEAIWLNLPNSGTKCVSEEIQNNVVVLADYYVIDEVVDAHHLPTVGARVCFSDFLSEFIPFVFCFFVYFSFLAMMPDSCFCKQVNYYCL